MKKLLFDWLFKLLEIVFAGILGIIVYLVIAMILAPIWAICGIAIVFYFFSPIIKPYIDSLRKWIYVKILGVDVE